MGKVMKSNELPVLPFASKKKWSAWLAKQHEKSSGVWLQLAKKDSGIPSVTYDEAVEVALCYGWIDGQKKGYDDKYWLQKFTPRGPKSIWSRINTQKAERLIARANCRICVVGLSPTTLPDGTENDPYSQTLTATGCANPPLSWQITAGALPAGLTLNENTGVISGTPTEDGDFNFTVTLQTEAT